MRRGGDNDPFERVINEADALREAAMDRLPSDLGRTLRAIVRATRTRPLAAIFVAALVGFVVAQITSR